MSSLTSTAATFLTSGCSDSAEEYFSSSSGVPFFYGSESSAAEE
jgi:hypothetical protein